MFLDMLLQTCTKCVFQFPYEIVLTNGNHWSRSISSREGRKQSNIRGPDGWKMIDLLGEKIIDPSQEKHQCPLFLPATPLYRCVAAKCIVDTKIFWCVLYNVVCPTEHFCLEFATTTTLTGLVLLRLSPVCVAYKTKEKQGQSGVTS